MDCSLPGSSVHGTFQARVLEWVAISSPGVLPDPGTEPRFPALEADSLPLEPPGKPKKVKSISQASLIAQMVKNLPAIQETSVRFLGREDLLEKGKATHSSISGLPLWFSW